MAYATGARNASTLPPERVEAVRQALEDGWSQLEIHRTLGVAPVTIRKYFPGSGWDRKQSAEFGALRLHTREVL
jgi:hypothetical protein